MPTYSAILPACTCPTPFLCANVSPWLLYMHWRQEHLSCYWLPVQTLWRGVAAQYGDAYARPWTAKLARGVAMNAPQYGGSEPCGMCIAYRGTGRGSGADPVPVDELQFALVTDLCPECAHGARPSQAR